MKRLDKRGRDITDLVGLYDEDDTILDPGCYVCLSVHPVAEWEPEDDPWADHYDRMMRQLREALDWIGGDWLSVAIAKHIDDATWAVIVEHDLEERLHEAIDRMVAANNPWPTEF